MSNTLPPDPLGRAQSLVNDLLAKGYTHVRIAHELGDRISPRTVYRWAKGEHAPQQPADMNALIRVAAKHAAESETPVI